MKERLIILMILFSLFTFGQSSSGFLKSISGKYQLDENGNISIVKIIEAPELDKNEIYNRALNFFIYNYISGKNVIQNKDREAGTLIGKGFYANLTENGLLIATDYGTWHILRIDIKDGKARAIITLTDYEIEKGDQLNPILMKISTQFPINQKAKEKKILSELLYKSYYKAIKTLDKVEKSIKEGSTSKTIENTDW